MGCQGGTFSLEIVAWQPMFHLTDLLENFFDFHNVLGTLKAGQGEHVDPLFALVAPEMRSLEENAL